MPKIIHILAHNIEDFMAGDYHDFDHHSIRFMEKIRKFSEQSQSNVYFEQELWTLTKKNRFFEAKHQKGFKIRFFPVSLKLPLPLEISFPLLKEIIKHKSQETIWHLHSYYLFIYDFIAPLLFIKRQKFIMHFHGGGPSWRLKSFLYTLYHYLIGLRITLNLANFVIVINHNEEKRVKKFLWVKKEKIIYFPSTVPLNSLTEKQVFEALSHSFKMVIASRIEKIRKKNFIMPMFKKILTENKNCILEIIGLKQKNNYLNKLQEKFPEQIQLIPWLGKDDLLKKFQEADIYLHLFRKNEGLPITLIEALSQGLPVLAFNVEGVRDAIKNNFNGWLVENEREFEKKLQEIIKNSKQALEIKNNCLSSIKENFLGENYFPKLIEIYYSLIKTS